MEHRLIVVGPDNATRELRLQADSPAHAARLASASGVRVLSFVENAAHAGARSLGRFDLLLFSQELVALLQAGLNVNAALQALAAKESRPQSMQVLEAIVRDLEEGRSLSDSLSRYPAHFPQIFVAGVRANEKSGGLATAIERYVQYQQQVDVLRRKVISASIYPALLVSVGLFVTLFLIGYVVPKFSAVYDSAGRDVPLLSLFLITIGAWINRNLVLFAIGVTGGMALAVSALMRPEVRARIARRVADLPWLRQRSRQYRLGRLYRTISLLLHAGIALSRAASMASETLTGQERDALSRARRALDEGRSLSEALRSEGLSTSIADSLIRVGESSGSLGDMLERAARFHDEEFSRWIDTATRLVEPLLMIAIGLVIGAIVVLMYLPIFELAGNLR